MHVLINTLEYTPSCEVFSIEQNNISLNLFKILSKQFNDEDD